jgi:hypothetical protein
MVCKHFDVFVFVEFFNAAALPQPRKILEFTWGNHLAPQALARERLAGSNLFFGRGLLHIFSD